MSGGAMSASVRSWRHRVWLAAGESTVAALRGLVFCLLMIAGIGPLLALFLALAVAVAVVRIIVGQHSHGQSVFASIDPLAKLGILPLLIVGSSVLATRRLASVTRRLAGRWCGVQIAVPYRPRPAAGTDEPGPWRQLRLRLGWLATDPATWRDLLWLVIDACGGWVVAVAPAGLVLYGLACAVPPILELKVDPGSPASVIIPTGPAAIAPGVALAAAGLWAAPRLLRAYGGLARLTLGPTRRAELTSRVTHLAQTRADTIDTGAAELRRIERDLHDGAQVRLVAMGMNLDAADQLLDTNPAAARALLAEARDSSAQALVELRNLVRGIHPPVLADRGLADAVRALALDSPVRASVAGELAGRPPAAVESAAYFAVSELLANAAKHAGAGRVRIAIRHDRGTLRIGVADDGRGGADSARGTGMRGIERRLAAFDGVLMVSSPRGGPTTVNLEIPCALSLPKISSC